MSCKSSEAGLLRVSQEFSRYSLTGYSIASIASSKFMHLSRDDIPDCDISFSFGEVTSVNVAFGVRLSVHVGVFSLKAKEPLISLHMLATCFGILGSESTAGASNKDEANGYDAKIS